jgi:hypothetical protein
VIRIFFAIRSFLVFDIHSNHQPGPDVIAATFDGTTWIYYTAPFVGVCLSGGIYWLLKVSRYETANEGQDGDETEQALVLRDTKGNITGAVERVDMDRAPDLVPALANQASRGPSVTSLSAPPVPEIPTNAPPAVAAAAAADGSHVSQPGITNEDGNKISTAPTGFTRQDDTDKRDFSPVSLSPTTSNARPGSATSPASVKDLGFPERTGNEIE